MSCPPRAANFSSPRSASRHRSFRCTSQRCSRIRRPGVAVRSASSPRRHSSSHSAWRGCWSSRCRPRSSPPRSFSFMRSTNCFSRASSCSSRRCGGTATASWHGAARLLGALWVWRSRTVLGAPSTHALAGTFGGRATFDDPQGAIALLPAFQVGLYVALVAAAFTALTWQRFVAGLALLVVSQAVVYAALPFVVRHAGFMLHVRDIRAWAPRRSHSYSGRDDGVCAAGALSSPRSSRWR